MAATEQRALSAGRAAFGRSWSPEEITRAPGRLELLGNHVDYNGGPVLAAAIERDVVCLVKAGRDSDEIGAVFADRNQGRPISMRPEGFFEWRIDGGPARAPDYLRGVIAAGLARGAPIRSGLEIAVAGDVPIGFGLSSSAALCVALTLALHADQPDGIELVKRAQEAEHRAGTPCGTMDQSASAAGDVILFDGATLSFTNLRPNLNGFVFVVADSGVGRALSTSSYPVRVEESKRATAEISRLLNRPLGALAELQPSELRSIDGKLDPALMKRARHVVSEIARVREGVSALEAGDWLGFGALMNASGRSSAFDYEISHPKVEELVAEAQAIDGVCGARMMGGGEGGAALILLRRESFPSLLERLSQGYYRRHRLGDASQRVLVQTFGPGARREVLLEVRREGPL